MDKLLNPENVKEWRGGKSVDMEAFLGELDSEYLTDLDGTIEAYQTYDEVSQETYNDYKLVCSKLEMLRALAYLDDREFIAMRETAAEMRLKKLEALEHEETRF